MTQGAAAQFFTYTVPANSSENVMIPCDFIHCVSSTGIFYVKSPDAPGSNIYFTSNSRYKFTDEVNSFQIINQSASPVTVNLIVGYGDYDFGGVTVAGQLSAVTRGGGSVEHGSATIGTAPVMVRGANPNRTSWSLHNVGAAGLTIFLGKDNTVTPATGFPLLPVEKYGEDSTGEIWACTSSATEELRWRVVNV